MLKTLMSFIENKLRNTYISCTFYVKLTKKIEPLHFSLACYVSFLFFCAIKAEID